jgi:hypothetical protein
MICTPTFTFMHLHKTGGQSINDALLHCIKDAREVGYHLPLRLLPEEAKQRPIIGVIRDPWDWYVSWYAFNNLRGVKNPLFNIVSRGKQAGFSETIENLARYPETSLSNNIMKRSHRALLTEQFENDGGAGFTKGCVSEFESPTEGYYSLLVKRMLGEATANVHLIRFESLQQDLIAVLDKLNVAEAEAIRRHLDNQPKKNSSSRGHYAQYYDAELSALIGEKEKALIERFGYTFNVSEGEGELVSIEPGERVKKVDGQAISFLRVGDVTNLSSLKTKVAALTEADWAQSDRHTQFDIHKETQSIQLLADDMSHTPPIKTAFYDRFAPDLEPILAMLADRYGPRGTFIRVLLARLNAHSEIKPHVDKGYSLVNCNRIHIPLITNERVTFSVGGVSQVLLEGEVWEINNADVHAVTNASDDARVHLIIDWTPSETLLKEKKPFRMDLPMFYRPEFRLIKA